MVTEGQRFPNAHCPEYDVEILLVEDDRVIARCHNPQCPDVCGCGQPCAYDGVLFHYTDELPEYLFPKTQDRHSGMT